jgi:dimethylhistidine N-methyltransferase
MSSVPELELPPFAFDVLTGLVTDSQKKLAPKYFYDDLGSKLFEAITLLPEYGLSRADSRLLARCSKDVARRLGSPGFVAELGSGVGKKTSHILEAIPQRTTYYPIDVSREALSACRAELSPVADVRLIHAEYFEGLQQISRQRTPGSKMLLLFVGSSIGNFEPEQRHHFLRALHENMRPGDLFLLGADLVKDVDEMIEAYDDAAGVTAAFNLNLLNRMNRELDANFHLKSFTHMSLWNHEDQRIEMHLVSRKKQRVLVRSLRAWVEFDAGETIWTESSHKFTVEDLDEAAASSGFQVLETWTDSEWPFAETLWQV